MLLKKYTSGKFTAEDHQALRETTKPQQGQQELNRTSQHPSSSSFQGNANLSLMIQQNLPSGLSQASSRNNSREPSKTDRPLPQLNPQLNVQDINYSFKEKSGVGSAPHKAANTQQLGPSMFGSTLSSSRNNPQEVTVGFQPSMSRDPRNEFKRVPSSGGSKPIQNHSVLLYPPSYKSNIQSPNLMISSHLKGSASKSFDLESHRQPGGSQGGMPLPQPSIMSQTGRKFKSPQSGDYANFSQGQGDSNPGFKRGSSAGHQESPTIPSSILSPSHTVGSGQYQSEPKSRKLLEMMLKKITKVGTSEMESERRTNYQTPSQYPTPIQPAPSRSKPSHEVLKPQFLEMKSLSVDQSSNTQKKKLFVSNPSKNGGQDSTHNSRRSSKDSVYNHQVPQPTNYPSHQTPSSMGHGVLKPNVFVTPGANTIAQPSTNPGSGYGNTITLNKSKLIQIRNVKMRSPLAPMSSGGGAHYHTQAVDTDTFHPQNTHTHSYDYSSHLKRP